MSLNFLPRFASIRVVTSHITDVVVTLSSLLAISCSGVLAQESVTVHGPEFVKAGERFNLILTVDKAPNFTGSSLQVGLQGPKGNFGYGIELEPGKTEYSLQVAIPEGAAGGTWSVGSLNFNSGGGEVSPPVSVG
jgi:hypothetical protein